MLWGGVYTLEQSEVDSRINGRKCLTLPAVSRGGLEVICSPDKKTGVRVCMYAGVRGI